jgi:hypothetical protein
MNASAWKYALIASVALAAVVSGCAPQPSPPPPPAPAAPAIPPMTVPPPPAPGQTLSDVLMPGGHPVGRAKPDETIRRLPGGESAATALFDRLTAGAKQTSRQGTFPIVRRLSDGSTVSYQPPTSSGAPATILINSRQVTFHRIEFPEGFKGDDGGGGM